MIALILYFIRSTHSHRHTHFRLQFDSVNVDVSLRYLASDFGGGDDGGGGGGGGGGGYATC